MENSNLVTLLYDVLYFFYVCMRFLFFHMEVRPCAVGFSREAYSPGWMCMTGLDIKWL